MKLSVREGRPSRREEVWVRRAEKENALFDPATESVLLLNDTALAIWELCDGDTHPEEMVVAICDLSGLHEEVVAEDVERTLTEFDKAGLLNWVAE
jgi:hypothetical protein